ncbi:hypothetical protein L286_23295 [Sphingobium sp. HDIP04]|nr:hypothetical protein L286_23295 [Sphingobium sp. HDIP04]
MDSRSNPDPVPNIRRRRKCQCGQRFTTKEVVVDGMERRQMLDLSDLPLATRAAFRQLHAAALRRDGV